MNGSSYNSLKRTSKPLSRVLPAQAGLAACILAADLFIPLGVAGGIPYVAVVLISLWNRQRFHIIAAGLVCSLLIVVGFIFSPAGGIFWQVVTNRILAIAAVWIISMLTLIRLNSELKLERINEELDFHMKEATTELEKAKEKLNRELTERTRLYEILSENEERSYQISERCGDMLWLTSLDRQELYYMSAAFETIWGISRESAYKNPALILDGVYPEDREKAFAIMKDTEPKEYSHEYRVVRADGSIRWVWCRGFPIKDIEDNDYRMAGFVSDITERVNAKKRERDQELKLMHADRLSSVGRLAAGVAHEIKNPMTALYGMVQDLCEAPDSCDKKTSTAMLNVCRRIIKIVEQLLAFSSQLKPERSLADVNKVIADTLSLISPHLLKQRITLKLDLSQGIPLMMINPSQMQQVFTNLVFNAIDAMDTMNTMDDMQDGGLLAISTEIRDGAVVISFVDTGCGIAADDLDKVFFPFYTNKDVWNGTGLGLYISYGIIREHGGEISVSSELDKGCRFEIILPAIGSE